LLLGAPNAVARDRIATRLIPALRQALTATIGVTVRIEVVVETRVEESRRASGEESERRGA
jgi:hypothetical protein